MAIRNTKHYLQRAYRLSELISCDLNELQALRFLSKSITPDISREPVRGGNQKDKMGSIVAKIIDLENDINDEIERYVDLKKEIRDVIVLLPNKNEQLLLRLRYIEFLTWEQVAQRMSYSLKQVFRIHGEAIKNISVLER